MNLNLITAFPLFHFDFFFQNIFYYFQYFVIQVHIIILGLRLRGIDDSYEASISERIDQNLEQMCGNISTLKNLAVEMGNEIEYQNSLVEDITYKAEKADITIKKQTKEMNRLMK